MKKKLYILLALVYCLIAFINLNIITDENVFFSNAYSLELASKIYALLNQYSLLYYMLVPIYAGVKYYFTYALIFIGLTLKSNSNKQVKLHRILIYTEFVRIAGSFVFLIHLDYQARLENFDYFNFDDFSLYSLFSTNNTILNLLLESVYLVDIIYTIVLAIIMTRTIGITFYKVLFFTTKWYLVPMFTLKLLFSFLIYF